MTHDDSVSFQDLLTIPSNPKDEDKIKVIDSIAPKVEKLDKNEQMLAVEVLRLLMQDGAVIIRQKLAEAVKHVSYLPKDMVINMAKDVHEVSLPILEFSPLLEAPELLEIIQSLGDEPRYSAIAKRSEIPASVSHALCDKAGEEAINTLLENPKATLFEKSYIQVVNRFSESQKLIDSIFSRTGFSVTENFIQTLVNQVSDTIIADVKAKYPKYVSEIESALTVSKEVVGLQMQGAKISSKEIEQLTNRLKQDGKLQPITALVMGNLSLFTVSVARMSGVSAASVQKLVSERSGKGVKALFIKVGFPMDMHEVLTLLIKIIHQLEDNMPSPVTFNQEFTEEFQKAFKAELEKSEPITHANYILSLMQN